MIKKCVEASLDNCNWCNCNYNGMFIV